MLWRNKWKNWRITLVKKKNWRITREPYCQRAQLIISLQHVQLRHPIPQHHQERLLKDQQHQTLQIQKKVKVMYGIPVHAYQSNSERLVEVWPRGKEEIRQNMKLTRSWWEPTKHCHRPCRRGGANPFYLQLYKIRYEGGKLLDLVMYTQRK